MSRRDERAVGYLILLAIYVVYFVAIYIYDKLKALYQFLFDFYLSNSDDMIFWLIIATVAVCFWYLGYWLASKKKAKIETAKSELTHELELNSKHEMHNPEIEITSQLEYEQEGKQEGKAISEPLQLPIYWLTVAAGSIPKIESSSMEETKADNENPVEKIATSKDNPASVILGELHEEGIDVTQSHIEDRLKLPIELLHMPEAKARSGTLNYFRKYWQLQSKHVAHVIDFYESPEWRALARQIRERDRFICQHCGKDGPNDKKELHVHHIIPRGRGGSNDPSNLITLCSDCHEMQPHHER